jgi:hypothetical protein
MNTNNWAAPPVGKDALATLHQAEARLPVSLIATDRNDLFTCRPDDDAQNTATSQQVADFDYLPVESDGVIVGLFSRKEEYAQGTVREVMRPLCERLLMSADASMLHFLETADERRFMFLVSENQISGAVSLSDIQKLAARPPIFLRLTLFEILVTNWIRTHANDTWLDELKPKEQRQKIESNFKKRSAAGEEVDLIAVADLLPKLEASLALGAFEGFPDASEQLPKLSKFRNRIAHAGDFAANVSSASAVPQFLRQLRDFISHFEAMQSSNQEPT